MIFINKIIKSSTESTDFSFLNKWEVYDAEGNRVEIPGTEDNISIKARNHIDELNKRAKKGISF